MDLFDRIFGNKDDKTLIPLRIQAGEKFKAIINAMGINSFQIQVGDEDGNNTDKLVLITKNANNPDIQGFLQGSLTKPHTAKNLMSIGFKQILIVVNDGSGKGSFIDLKDYAG